jgi:Primase C terminal 1 (PriCT-1)
MQAVLDGLRQSKNIPDGKRNHSLFHIGLEQSPHVDDFESLLDVMRTRNMECTPPLPDEEVVKAAQSAWKYQQEGRNLVGRGRSFVLSHQLFDRLDRESPDAWRLLSRLSLGA